MPAFYVGAVILAVAAAVLSTRRLDIPGLDIAIALIVVVCLFAEMLILAYLFVIVAASISQFQ